MLDRRSSTRRRGPVALGVSLKHFKTSFGIRSRVRSSKEAKAAMETKKASEESGPR